MKSKPNYARFYKCLHGFTLVELLVVISIIALLLSILLPSLNKARKQAQIIVCAGNLRQLGVAMNCYQVDNKGEIPYMHLPNYPYAGPIVAREEYRGCGYYVRSVGVSLWPYLKNQKSFYCPVNFKDWSSGWNANPNNPAITNRSIGYIYFGNIPEGAYPKYKNFPRGKNFKSNQLLMQDMVMRYMSFYGWTSHTATKVEGGNGLFSGGQVKWIPVSKMSDWIDPTGNELLWYKWFVTQP